MMKLLILVAAAAGVVKGFPLGFWAPGRELTEADKRCTTTVASKSDPCEAGHGRDKDQKCVECAKNEYSDGSTPCKPCPAGSFTDGTKASECKGCGAGSEYTKDDGKETYSCKECPVGKAALDKSACVPCGKGGSWASKPGLAACEFCGAGESLTVFAIDAEAAKNSQGQCTTEGTCIGYDPKVSQSAHCQKCGSGSGAANFNTQGVFAGSYMNSNSKFGGETCQECLKDVSWSVDGVCNICPGGSTFMAEYKDVAPRATRGDDFSTSTTFLE